MQMVTAGMSGSRLKLCDRVYIGLGFNSQLVTDFTLSFLSPVSCTIEHPLAINSQQLENHHSQQSSTNWTKLFGATKCL